MKGPETVLVVVAHSDDETLGAGGVIARHADAGCRVVALSLTDGVGARKDADAEAVRLREAAARKAAGILRFEWLPPAALPDNALDSVPLLSVVRLIEEAKAAVAPTLVYTHSAADLNVDHRVVAEAVLTAFRPQPGERCRELRAIEIPSATDFGHRSVTGAFHPNLHVDIAGTWPRKEAALEAYAAEMRAAPHSRSVEGLRNLARLRGNEAGLPMAEAFEILRRIEP